MLKLYHNLKCICWTLNEKPYTFFLQVSKSSITIRLKHLIVQFDTFSIIHNGFIKIFTLYCLISFHSFFLCQFSLFFTILFIGLIIKIFFIILQIGLKYIFASLFLLNFFLPFSKLRIYSLLQLLRDMIIKLYPSKFLLNWYLQDGSICSILA